MAVFQLESVAQIKARITSLNKRGQKFDTDAHITAVQCLAHAEQHGDWTLATKLVHIMPRSSRRKALIMWFRAHGPCTYSEKNGFKKDKRSEAQPFNVSEADKVPFYEFTKEIQPAEFTLDAAMKRLRAIVKKVDAELENDDRKRFHTMINDTALSVASNEPVPAVESETKAA